jgi:DNA polymerase type B, organellar and viral.
MRLHCKIGGGENIQDVDVMSLYPFVCKYFKFPRGHPAIHVGDARQDMETMPLKDGLLKCSILPPRHLYHPIVTFRGNNIYYWLCKKCAIQQNRTTVCTHETVSERAPIAMWIPDEIRLAVLKGYETVEVQEVYEYQVTQ